jgi:hypothetical protein
MLEKVLVKGQIDRALARVDVVSSLHIHSLSRRLCACHAHTQASRWQELDGDAKSARSSAGAYGIGARDPQRAMREYLTHKRRQAPQRNVLEAFQESLEERDELYRSLAE